MATALDSDGDIQECLTVDTSCYFTNMMCGKNYSFTVSSYYSGELNCNSGNTNPVTVVTGELYQHTRKIINTHKTFTYFLNVIPILNVVFLYFS